MTVQPDYQCPLADYPRFYAEHTSDNIAYIDGENQCTYRELNLRSNQVANGLISQGCEPGDRVAFLGINSGPGVEVLFGTNKANAIYVGLNWRLTPVELEFILNDAGAKFVFCDQQFVEMLELLKPKVPSMETIVSVDQASYTLWRDQFNETDPGLVHNPEDKVVQFYTSGTTGKPKGVQLTNQSMGRHRWSEDNYGDWYIKSDPREIIINAMPNFHIGGLGWLLIGLYRGAKVILMGAPDPDKFLDLIEQQQVTHLFAVPVVLGMMLESQKKRQRDLSSLKVFHYGASPIAPSVLKDAIEVMNCGFCQYYGMTETNGTVCVLSPENHDPNDPVRLKSCGKAIPGAEIKICDSEGNEMPTNQAGELWVKTPAVMSGYWKRPEATAEVMVHGWYKSGDGARIDENGFIFMADRIKDMIVSGGENIYPTEIENALYEHPAVAEVAVIGVPDEKWGEAVKSVIVFSEGHTATSEELILFLRERLAGYKIPRMYEFVDALPRTPSGKIQKFKLRK